MKNWNELSIRDKNDIIKVAVQNGITTLPEIRERYNEFAEGGNLSLREEEYQDRIRQVAKENWRNWGYNSEEEAYRDQLNNPTYDYRSFYANNPGADNNANTHWPDTYKAASHPTFSNESIYSGNVHPIYNPSGARGGRWDKKGYVPHGDTLHVPFNMLASGGKIHIKDSKKGTFTAAASKHGMGVQAFASRVLAHPENYSPAMRKKANFARNAAKWHGLGGNLYDGESEDSQQMNVTNSYPISLQDYIAQRIQDTRDSAINVMNTREYPKVYFNSSPDYLNKYINDTKTAIRGNENFIAEEYQKLYRGWAKGAEKYSYDAIERARKNIEEWRNNIDLVRKYNKAPEGATCIFTVTDSYGNERAVPGNLSWLAKGKSGRPIYEEKGFKLLGPIEALAQGDIIQQVNSNGIPEHSIMNMGETEQYGIDCNDGYLIDATYSDGNYGKDAMKRHSVMRYVPGHDNAFRFVGNAADSARWTREYNELMQNGPLVGMAMGGRLNGK